MEKLGRSRLRKLTEGKKYCEMPKIIKLGASWCMPCKVFEKTLEQIKSDKKYEGIEFASYDVENDEEGQRLAFENKVSGVPTTLFMNDDGEVVFRMVGNVPRKDVENAIEIKLLNDKKV